MNYLDIAARIIPGYNSLSKRRRTAFEQSTIGLKFSKFVHDSITITSELEGSLGWWDHVFGDAEKKIQALQDKLNWQKEALIQEIHGSDEYHTIMLWIRFNALKKEYPDFQLLGKKQQKILANAPFSQQFLAKLLDIDRLIVQETRELSQRTRIGISNESWKTLVNYIDELKNKKKLVMMDWRRAFEDSAEMAPLRNNIVKRKQIVKARETAQEFEFLKEHAQQLALFFPLLYYRKSIAELPMIQQLCLGYFLKNGEVTFETDKIDEAYLTDILYHCMKIVNQAEISFINLGTFNKKQATHMAHAILQHFNESKALEIDRWFQIYEDDLYQHMMEQLRCIHGSRLQTTQTGVREGILNSLSSLFHNKTTDAVNEFIRKLGDAHAFIQATGFSTQNESSFLAILDAYNYGRHIEQIAEAKSIIMSLLRPLQPLYDEYKDIAFYERNEFWKAVRTTMPLLITVAFIILIAVILSPLALPELAFAAAFIPAFLIGISLAAKYVSVKNDVYKYLRNKYYGGPFEIPEFQINERMIHAFHGDNNAQKVRQFYVEALAYCDRIETIYSAKQKQGLLSQEDIIARKENTNKRHQLCLEWYDVHSNNDLSYSELPHIVLNRLQIEIDKEYLTLENILHEERDRIRLSVQQVTTDLKATIVSHNNPQAAARREAFPIISTQYTPGLFSPPRCLPHKAHIENMVTLSTQIRPN